MEEEKCCGDCCWFYGENTDGYGFCAHSPIDDNMVMCDMCCKTSFVSRQEMRHHMAVLLQWKRYMSDKSELTLYRPPLITDRNKAMEFAYRYMKVFSNL